MNFDIKGGWGASIGVTRLEAYKARWMLMMHYGKEKWENATLGEVIDQLLDPSRAIRLTAAYLAYLKKTINI